MANRDSQRAVGAFSKAVSLEVKGLMARHGITQTAFAAALDRNQGYISERVNGIKAFDTDELDIFAGLIGITGQDLLTTVSRRIYEDSLPANVTVGGFGQDRQDRYARAADEWTDTEDNGEDTE
ncbi:helix-turn-helix transcriptional regulator [Leucobacter sp. NPDC077196]|uniref:helix-turn-helix domain-containing protein n=1 Tax=Leucobacter sp. NPDC077196 TaxID=3154959 RepID=UPI00343DCB28